MVRSDSEKKIVYRNFRRGEAVGVYLLEDIWMDYTGDQYVRLTRYLDHLYGLNGWYWDEDWSNVWDDVWDDWTFNY